NDMNYDLADRTQDIFDAKGDPWARIDEEYTNSDSNQRMRHGTFTVRVTDENSLLPINLANKTVLMYLLRVLGLDDDEEVERTAAAIIDYYDEDDLPVLEETEYDYEDRAYEELIKEQGDFQRNDRVYYV